MNIAGSDFELGQSIKLICWQGYIQEAREIEGKIIETEIYDEIPCICVKWCEMTNILRPSEFNLVCGASITIQRDGKTYYFSITGTESSVEAGAQHKYFRHDICLALSSVCWNLERLRQCKKGEGLDAEE